MADNNIQFQIGSVFSGEGFTKAQDAVKSMNGEVNKSMQGMQQLGGAMGQLNTQASGTVKTVTGLLNAFTSMSITTGLIQAGVIGLNKVLGDLNDRLDRANEIWDKIQKGNQADFIAKITGNSKDLLDQVTALSAEYAKVAKEASAFASAFDALGKSQASGSIINLEIEKFNAVMNEMSENGKKVTAAEYDLEIAIQKQKNAQDEATRAVEKSRDAYNASEKNLAALEKAETDAIENLSEAERAFGIVAANYEAGSEEYKAAEGELNAAKKALAETTSKADAARSESTNKLIELETKEQNLANVTNEYALEVQKAKNALAEASNGFSGIKDDASAFIAAAQAQIDEWNKEGLTDAKDALAEAMREGADAQKKANEATKNFEDANREYQEALAQYNKNIVDNQLNEAIKDGTLGKAEDAKKRQQAAANQAVNEGIASGDIRNSWQQHQTEMNAARRQRDKESSADTRREKADQQRADRIKNMNEKARSKQDQKFLDDFNKRQKKKDEEAQRLKDAEKKKKEAEEAKKDAEENLKNMQANIAAMKDNVGKLNKLDNIAENTSNLAQQSAAIEAAVNVLNDAIKLN